ncbi:MAG TPA: Xaa-Pro peptidase family protein [Terriglobales bacterium]
MPSLVTHMANIRYLTGFTGSAGVLASADGKFAFFTDGRYTTQAREQVRNARVVTSRKSALNAAAEWLSARKLDRVAIEADHVTVQQAAAIRRALKQAGASAAVKGVAGELERLRMVKDESELARIRAAVALASEQFEVALAAIRPGNTELDVAAELEYGCRRAGAEGMAFDTLCSAGLRSAFPHGTASQNKLPKRGFVILDYGVILAGYCSDMTRTVFIGRASAKERSMYGAVLEAHEAAKAAVKPGATAGEVDDAARKVLSRAKLEKFFTHSTGHGVGLEIHEPPRIGRQQTELLRPGMVITIEPGVYVPGLGGVRIEDMVLVTNSGCETLTPTPKEFVAL